MDKVFKALSHPARREIIALLRKNSCTAGEISARFDVTKPTMSGHLAVLREADLIYAERKGTHLVYHLKISVLEDVMSHAFDAFGLGSQPKGNHDD